MNWFKRLPLMGKIGVGAAAAMFACCGGLSVLTALFPSDRSAPEPTATQVTQPTQPPATAAPAVDTAKPTATASAVPPTTTRQPTETRRPANTATQPPAPTNTKAPSRSVIQPTAVPQPTQEPAQAVQPTAEPTQPPAQPTTEPTQPPPPPSGGYVCDGGQACVKGNINSDGERIYHFPGCASYNRTEIDESKGERWFTSSAEAEAAGWRKAGNCP